MKQVFIKGEISNFTNHAKTGHFYFTLKDSSSSISAIMFNENASRLKFMPTNGMKVIIFGDISVYERDGKYQIYAKDIKPDGVGQAFLQFEQLKEKLLAEGLFDKSYKKELPTLPKKIGIVTSESGAAVQDMLNVINNRFPMTEIVIYPCLVQGVNAPTSICSALENADLDRNDVIIVGRGGGSIEDLSAFNDEGVARMIFSAKTPIVSGVGHETDFTIADYVADLRAETPTAAAVAVVPDINAMLEMIGNMNYTLQKRVQAKISDYNRVTLDLERRISLNSPKKKIEFYKKSADEYETRIARAFENSIKRKKDVVLQKIELLDSLSPTKIMLKGFSVVHKDGEVVSSSSKLKIGDEITVTLANGKVKSSVTEVL